MFRLPMVFVFTLILLAGCAGTNDSSTKETSVRSESASEATIKEMIAEGDELFTLLESVQDEKSAEAAIPKLKNIATKIISIRERFDNLRKEGKEPDVFRKYEPLFKEKDDKIKSEMKRIKMIDGTKEFLEEFKKIGR